MEFLDGGLRRLAAEPGRRPTGWTNEAIQTYYETVQCVDAAETDADLLALRSLNMQQRPDLKPGAWSIPLDATLVLILTFKIEGTSAVAVLDMLQQRLGGAR